MAEIVNVEYRIKSMKRSRENDATLCFQSVYSKLQSNIVHCIKLSNTTDLLTNLKGQAMNVCVTFIDLSRSWIKEP